MANLNIAGAALNQTPLDWRGNVRNILDAIEEARINKVDILCLPELCITGYGCEDLYLSDWLPLKAMEYIPRIRQACLDITVCLGLPILIEKNLYNCALVIDNQKISAVYAKQFLAKDGVHYEPRWFTAWEQGKITKRNIAGEVVDFGDVIVRSLGVNIGFEICEDAWRINRPACRLVDKNIHLILNPSASHFAMGKTDQRKQLVIDSTNTFKCVYVYANLLGNEAGRLIYDGEVLIAGKGQWLGYNGNLSFRNYNLVKGKFDFSCNDGEFKPSPPNSDKFEEFVQAASLGLFDYLRKSKSKGYVVSLSGGADSSCCAVLVTEMIRRGVRELGRDAFLIKLGRSDLVKMTSSWNDTEAEKFILSKLLTCAYQGSKNSSQETLKSASRLADSLGASFYKWIISNEVATYSEKIEKVLGRKLSWEKDDVALQNIQARARSPIIWMLANIKNSILLTTSNRSEGDVGYATMDGDTSGSLAPIAAVDKHFILSWLQWAEKVLGYAALKQVNSLNPTAELRPPEKGQTDEKDLMPYPIIVKIEKLAIRDHKSPVEVYDILRNESLEADSLLKQHIIKFYRLWSQNQWKRERTAAAFHLDDFNIDPRTWCRFPILSNYFVEEIKDLEELD